jgi:uncharacterized protein (TIGR03086 family)
MDLLTPLSETFDHTAKVVAGIKPDQLTASTPCRDWDVRQLMAHMLGVVTNTGRGARGEALLDDINAVPLDADLAGQFRTVADDTLAAWMARGLDGEVNIGAGPRPVIVGVSINLLDTSTHSWDIARATGQDAALPDALATIVLGVAQGFVTDELRRFAGFDPAIPLPADAAPTDQLVAFLGRRP